MSILGGPGDDVISDLAVDEAGELAVSGSFSSSWFWFGPTTIDDRRRVQTAGSSDGFLTAFPAPSSFSTQQP